MPSPLSADCSSQCLQRAASRFTVGTTELENITDNDAQDIFPMWIGDKIYFLSDRDQIMNLFCYDTATKETKKVTDFTEYDCKFPSFSQDWIVFENGGYIYKYSVKDGSCSKVAPHSPSLPTAAAC